MRVFTDTNIGHLRSSNQDTFRQGMVSETCVWSLICDGMGGASGGSVASGIAADTIAKLFEEQLSEALPEEELRALCINAVNEANSAVFARSIDEPALKGMGTTVVLAIMRGDTLYLSHVGDSCAYLKNQAGVRQITTDHSYVQSLVDKGALTREEAKVHPHRNIITRVVGVHSMVEVDFQEQKFLPGDIFVSCSDGMSNYLNEEALADFLESAQDTQVVAALIQHALDAGGADNITVSVIYG